MRNGVRIPNTHINVRLSRQLSQVLALRIEQRNKLVRYTDEIGELWVQQRDPVSMNTVESNLERLLTSTSCLHMHAHAIQVHPHMCFHTCKQAFIYM